MPSFKPVEDHCFDAKIEVSLTNSNNVKNGSKPLHLPALAGYFGQKEDATTHKSESVPQTVLTEAPIGPRPNISPKGTKLSG